MYAISSLVYYYYYYSCLFIARLLSHFYRILWWIKIINVGNDMENWTCSECYIIFYSISLCVNVVLFLELEAIEACEWLREAGFPQYAQLYRSM